MLQQIAVIARDLKDLARRPETQPIFDPVDIFARMLDPGGRVRREICVLCEDVLRLDIFLQLHKEASIADENVQGKVRLHPIQLVDGEETFTKRGHPEIDERCDERRTAQPAASPVGKIRIDGDQPVSCGAQHRSCLNCEGRGWKGLGKASSTSRDVFEQHSASLYTDVDSCVNMRTH